MASLVSGVVSFLGAPNSQPNSKPFIVPWGCNWVLGEQWMNKTPFSLSNKQITNGVRIIITTKRRHYSVGLIYPKIAYRVLIVCEWFCNRHSRHASSAKEQKNHSLHVCVCVCGVFVFNFASSYHQRWSLIWESIVVVITGRVTVAAPHHSRLCRRCRRKASSHKTVLFGVTSHNYSISCK